MWSLAIYLLVLLWLESGFPLLSSYTTAGMGYLEDFVLRGLTTLFTAVDMSDPWWYAGYPIRHCLL